MFSELNDVSYYDFLSKASGVLCVFLVVTLVFFLKKTFKNNTISKGKPDLSFIQACIMFLLFFSAMVSYFKYERYADKSAWLEVEPRYNEYVKNTKPEYSCAKYKGAFSAGRSGNGAPTFLLEDGSHILGYGDADPSLVNSLEKGERVCVKYLVMPPFLRQDYGRDKKILELSRARDTIECGTECKFM